MAQVDVDGEPVGNEASNEEEDDSVDALFRLRPEPVAVVAQEPVTKRARKVAPPPASSVATAAKSAAASQKSPSPAVVSATAAAKELVSSFPDATDLEDLGQWVYMNSIMFKVTGGLDMQTRMPPSTKITGWQQAEKSARRLYTRLTAFRTQLRSAWLQTCRDSGNEDMVKLANRMPYCKLVVRKGAKAKPLSDKPACIWSQETEELCEVALLPIQGGATVTLGNRCTPPELAGVGDPVSDAGCMCHLQTRFVDMLKCIHTLLFLFDYVNLDIDAALRKPSVPQIAGPWSPEMDAYWQRSFKGGEAANPLASLAKRAKEMVRFNCEVVRTQLPAEVVLQYLVPIPTSVSPGH